MYTRIISLAPSNTEIIYALGAEGKLVACTRFCDYPDEAKSRPKVGGWLDINDDLVKKYKPDLILTSTFVQNEITKRYKKIEMNVVALMPRTINGVFDSIIEIGKLVERDDAAKKLVQSMKDAIQKIKIRNQEKSKNESLKPRVYIEEWHKPPHVSGNWVPKMVEIAGGNLGLVKEGEYSRPVTNEEIKEYSPEIIILSICGLSKNADPKWILERPGWEKLDAVRNKKVFVIDDSLLNRPGPRLVEGIKEIANIVRNQ